MTIRNFVPHKAALANHAIQKHGARSFADIGGSWGVQGGYTIDILKNNEIDRAYLADGNLRGATRQRGEQFPQLELREGQFNEQAFINDFPEVDALVMFSILLHQANLDWDAFLEAWSPKARVIVVYNQMYKRDETVRFVDKGKDWYFKNVYHTNPDAIEEWFGRLDETHPSGRKWRDMHHYWQFGITTEDLIAKMKSLGFKLDLFENFGPFHTRKTPWFENEGFVFVREQARH